MVGNPSGDWPILTTLIRKGTDKKDKQRKIERRRGHRPSINWQSKTPNKLRNQVSLFIVFPRISSVVTQQYTALKNDFHRWWIWWRAAGGVQGNDRRAGNLSRQGQNQYPLHDRGRPRRKFPKRGSHLRGHSGIAPIDASSLWQKVAPGLPGRLDFEKRQGRIYTDCRKWRSKLVAGGIPSTAGRKTCQAGKSMESLEQRGNKCLCERQVGRNGKVLFGVVIREQRFQCDGYDDRLIKDRIEFRGTSTSYFGTETCRYTI